MFLLCILLSTQENSLSKYSQPCVDWQCRKSWRCSLDSTLPIDFVERDTNLNHVSKIWLGRFLTKITRTTLQIFNKFTYFCQVGCYVLHRARCFPLIPYFDISVVCCGQGMRWQWIPTYLGRSRLRKIQKCLFPQLRKNHPSTSFILPTADSDKHGFLWSLMSQICINVSMLQEAMISGSLGCQFTSLTTRVWAFRLCVVCNSYPPAPLKFNISIRVLLWKKIISKQNITKIYIFFFLEITSNSINKFNWQCKRTYFYIKYLTEIAHKWQFKSHPHSAEPTSYLLCRWNFFTVFTSSSKCFTAKYLRL